MKRTSLRAAVAVTCGALAAGAFAQPAQASVSEAVSNVLADTTSEAEQAIDYWTPERMRNAVSLDKLEVSKAPRADVASGKAKSVKATPAKSGEKGANAAADSTGDPWEGGGDVVNTTGRVFFKFDGQDASCSGNAVTSANGSTVMTAGHCVKMEGNWHTDWVFVPGYDNGEAPYGEWPAVSTHTTAQWESDEDINYDVGAAVVDEVGGQKLTDVVGGQGIAFNQERGQYMHAFGYPAAAPYDGERLIYCAGDSFDDFLFTDDHGLSCDMTGGSSGGPWFINFDESTGTGEQNSVNSFGYVFLPNVMFGPYFGDDAQAVYETASGS